MSEEIERRDDEGAAPTAGGAAAPADTAAVPSSADPQPQAEDELSRLLAEFDEGVKTAPAPQQPEQPSTIGEIDRLINELHQPQQPAAGEVESRARELYERERYRSQLTDEFNKHCDRGQQKIPDNLPSDYYRSELLAMSTADPRLEVAFEAQFHDPVAIRVALDQAKVELVRARINPQATPESIKGLEQQVWQLGVAANARVILLQAQSAIVKKANQRANIDPDLTADRAMVAAAVRGAGAKIDVAEPAPAFGYMSDAELKDYTRRNFGF
jgi:hypothetical protein